MGFKVNNVYASSDRLIIDYEIIRPSDPDVSVTGDEAYWYTFVELNNEYKSIKQPTARLSHVKSLSRHKPPPVPVLRRQKKKPKPNNFVQFRFPLAQRKGFEPLYTFLHNTISNRARSAAPPSLQQSYLILQDFSENCNSFSLLFCNSAKFL